MRFVHFGAVLGLSALCAAPAAAATLAAATLPVAATHAFAALARSQDLGPLDARTPMHLAVGLTPPNRAAIATYLRRLNTPGDPLYRHYLSPAQTRQLFSPAGAQVDAVASYLRQSGFTNLSVTPDNLLVTADGNPRTVATAFGAQEHLLSVSGRRIYANLQAPRLPARLSGAVSAVLGLSSTSMHTMQHVAPRRLASAASNCTQVPVLDICALNEFNPKGFQLAYDTWGGPTGANAAIAIFAEGDLSQVVTDLRTQEKLSGLPAVPVTVVPTGIASTDTSGADEWDLDTQYSSGMAQTLKRLYVYDAPSLTDADTAIEFDRFKTDDVAVAASASFGECEIFPDLDGALLTDDMIFSLAALQGQTVFASAGDTGATCPAPVVSMNGVPAGLPFQEYPASSTYVVAVGGTTLATTPAGTYDAELGWYSGGGGPSLIESPGYWQSGVVNTVATTLGARSLPDVAMDADPNTGASVIVDGVAEEVGGTSLSSPLALGVWARLSSAHGNKLGFAAPVLYGEYKAFVTAADATPAVGSLTQLIGGFHDVLIGANPLPAGPEYDFSTGLGSFEVRQQYTDISK